MSGKFLCVHGHFYQPPREDPWLDMIFPEGSAAPFRHWNERICRESYGPLAWARRMGSDGIFDIINCYEWMSFNVGPTLFRWIERSEPALYAKILEGDALSLKRWGHGNAIAQIYHHVIMPLASELDRDAEVAWAIADFESRFKRRPEGMWLSETACNTDTLETLADHGIAFTLLAPRQAEAIAELGTDDWQEVDEYSLNIKEPYLVELPSG
ncbi:MAG: glycoside hydrolase, partial [Spirochaetales bacterium]|nr:glycoside hydrolase [Spirochaetales bacterium]